MPLLYLLEGLRTPALTVFFSTVTHLGEENFFLFLLVTIFWCVSKAEGYFLMATGFAGTLLNQGLKMFFRIPRPWVLDERFTIVESARAEAGGYSFPSGHTQSAVGAFGGMARWHGQKAVRVTGIILCVLVPLSRMYLGVHTPLDVGVSCVLAVALIFAFAPLFERMEEKPSRVLFCFAGIAVLGLSVLAFVSRYPFPENVDAANLADARAAVAKLTGAVIGAAVGYEIEHRYVRFETRAPLVGQVLKVVVGAGVMLAMLSGLKPVMVLLFGTELMGHVVRYGLVVLFACCVWPMTFPFFARLGRKGTAA